LDDVLIATLYALVESDVVYCYLQGFDPAYKALSPGAQILAAVIDDAVREAKASVDFLRGREPYKYVWGAADRDTYRLCLCRTGLKKSSALAPAA
jgi:CelD/BcsL family acetyltransferase involved in cellulose biosynthesis